MPTTLADRRVIGRTDLSVSPLCLGGNVFGWTADRDDSFAVLDAYRAHGGNVIDTADAYSAWVPGHEGGESELIIGEWLRARGDRDSVILATKVAKLHSRPGLSAGNIRSAAEDSLRRLGTDRIDLYYAHQDDPGTPMEETLAAFDALVREGKVRYIAASNFTAPRLVEALRLAQDAGLSPYVAVQDHYNLVERREYETQLAPVVAAAGLGSLPYFGLARGFLTGKYRLGGDVDSPRATGVEQYRTDRGHAVLRAVESVAQRHATTMASVALAWLLARPTVTSPIASARTASQLEDLVAMATLDLTEEDIAELDAASA